MRDDCECTGPGWCARHQVYKNAHFVHLCQTNERYWNAWESGTGMGQIKPDSAVAVPVRGLGDRVEAMLKSVGVTPERYVEVKKLFGLPPTCGCAKRKEWLNRVGQWLNGE